jgi:hypothetical protein
MDLQSGGTLPLPNFMTFDAAPGLRLELTQVTQGPNNTVCAAQLDPNLPVCAIAPGSPFILQSTASGTTLTLTVRGVARDNTGTSSNFTGAFTTQIAGRTPSQVQANLLGGGFERSTYSAEFAITVPAGAANAVSTDARNRP